VAALNAAERERIPEMAQLLLDAGFHTAVLPLHEDLVREIRPTLGLLVAGGLFVLLIAGVNLTNLALARATARLRELATRCALGAGRWRVGRQVVVESLVLSLAGAGLGLLLGLGGLRLLGALGVERIPRGAEISLELPVVLATLAAAVAIGVVLGAIPVLGLFRDDLHGHFRQDARTGSASRRSGVARDVLVAVQVAVAAVLLVGAGLLLASFLELLSVDPGFRAAGVATATVSLPDSRYPDDAARRAFAERLVAEVRALAGVDRAAAATSIPFGESYSANAITIEGYVRPPGESLLAPFQSVVTPGYFEALGIPILDGRAFTQRDREDSLPVVIVDRSLVERRAAMVLALIFAGVALFLAAVGLYGVLAYAVARRTRELGIRVVLGSTARGILGLVLGRSARVTGLGLAAGLAGAFLLTRWMSGLLYGVEATDPRIYAVVAVVLAAVALAASLAPARRAARVDPAVVLAAE